MRVFISGISSTIGCTLSEHLLHDGYQVVGIDIVKSPHLPTQVEFSQVDIRAPKVVSSVAADCDFGIHLAVVAININEADTMSTNVFGAYSFLSAAKESNFQNTVLVSSAPVHLLPTKADNTVLQRTSDDDDRLYDLTKVLQEIVGRDFHAHGLPVICLRLGHVVFGSEELNLDRTRSLDKVDYCRGGWVAVEDVVTACSAAMRIKPNALKFECMNVVGSIGSRKRFQVLETESRLGITLNFDFKLYE